MSHIPLGPGWWQATDGKWYPPPHPAVAPLQPVAPPWPESTAEERRRRRTPPALVGLGVALLILGGGGTVLGNVIFNTVSASIVGSSATQEATGCTFVSDDKASAALGGQFTFEQLDGANGTTKAAADVRPLPDGTICLGTGRDGASDRTITVVRLDADDAPARFDRARTDAQQPTEQRGDGLTAAPPSSFSKDVQLGDQAFCTTADSTGSSGVLVRRGTVLLYVSTTAGTVAGTAASTAAANTSDTNCELAQRLILEIS